MPVVVEHPAPTVIGLAQRLAAWARFAMLPVLCGLTGCADVTASRLLNADFSIPGKPTCSSGLGSYSLPKTYLHVRVGLNPPANNKKPGYVLVGDDLNPAAAASAIKTSIRPDGKLNFCFDYLNSPTADDKITVLKADVTATADADLATQIANAAKQAPIPTKQNNRTQFLGAVLVNSTDQTVFIVRTLLRSFFILESGKTDFQPRGALLPGDIAADIEFDPFDPIESAEVNARLNKLGYCLILERFAFDSARTNPGSYCSEPALISAMTPSPEGASYLAYQMTRIDPKTLGVVYRPRLPYRLFVYKKEDPKGPEAWHLLESIQIPFENFSPVISVDIKRAQFSGRKTFLVFDRGELKRACVAKTSELEQFVSIPLDLAQSILALPGAMANSQVAYIQSERILTDARKNVYVVQQANIKALNDGTPAKPGDPKTAAPFSLTEIPFPDLSKPDTFNGLAKYNAVLDAKCQP